MPARQLTCGSLFAGIGGFDLGLERAGMRSVWQCEIDRYCQRVLAKHWPDVLRVPDVRDVRAGTVPDVDVICGGFPCQDISYAGLGAGITGARSGLWTEMLRVIRELRPRWVVVENVSALLARGLGRVLGDLAALGYDAEWDCIPAAAVGAPHGRDRVWLVAYPRDDASVADPDSMARKAGESCEGGCSPLLEPGEVERTFGRGGRVGAAWVTEPDVGRVADGVSARVDRLRALGNALVPQIAEWIGRRIVAYEEGVT